MHSLFVVRIVLACKELERKTAYYYKYTRYYLLDYQDLLDIYISSSIKRKTQALKSHYVMCQYKIYFYASMTIFGSALALLNEFSVIEINEGTPDTEASNYYAVSCLFTLLS